MNQLFLWDEQTWLYLDQAGILTGNALMLISILAGIYGFIMRQQLRNWFNRNQFPGIGQQQLDKIWDGLIFTVSRQELPIWVVQEIQPQWVGLLYTEHSKEQAQALTQKLEQQGIIIKTQFINDADSPEENYLKSKQMMREQQKNFPEMEIAVDITGGKVPMSLGAFMAAEECGIDSIYVTTDQKDKKPDMTSARIISISNNG